MARHDKASVHFPQLCEQTAHNQLHAQWHCTAVSTFNTPEVQLLLRYHEPWDMTPLTNVWPAHRTQHQMPCHPDSQTSDINHLMKSGPTFNKMLSAVSASESRNKLMLMYSTRDVWRGSCNTPHWPYAKSTYLRHARDASRKRLTWGTTADYITNTYRVQNVILGGLQQQPVCTGMVGSISSFISYNYFHCVQRFMSLKKSTDGTRLQKKNRLTPHAYRV